MTQETAASRLQIELLSDATFSRGEGTAGLVDVMDACFPDLADAAARVLGRSKSLNEGCRLRVGDALLPAPSLEALRHGIERQEHPLGPETLLAAFSEIRYQTAEDRNRGAPEKTTLRSTRVVLRGFIFEAALNWLDGYQPEPDDLQVLALCALATRHGGLGRNRGRGHLRCTIDGDLGRTLSLAEGSSTRRPS